MTYFGSVYGQIELKGKPPILSDEEIDRIYYQEYDKAKAFSDKYHNSLSADNFHPDRPADRQRSFDVTHREQVYRAIAQAQQDTDVEWYLNRISQEVARQSEKKAKLRQYYLNKIEQARQDTAREIFEEIEKNQGQYFYIESWPQYNTISISRNQIKWQALKQKYPGGKEIPIGYDGNTK